MRVTLEHVKSWSTGECGYIVLNAHQLRLLAIGWPLHKGWLKQVIGKEISPSTAAMIESLKGVTKKERKQILTSGGIDNRNLFQTKLF